ncbi:sporulation-specific csd4-like protein [Bulinus truncatus]|nr:sporulation-specific csd4-like protein [Bulinus truncatus]
MKISSIKICIINKIFEKQNINFFFYFVLMFTFVNITGRCLTLAGGSASNSEWSQTGCVMNKPEMGWIHPDVQLLPDAGICYGVRYVGCLEIKESMKSLDFETRTTIARESINRVAEAAGLKTVSKRKKDRAVSCNNTMCHMLTWMRRHSQGTAEQGVWRRDQEAFLIYSPIIMTSCGAEKWNETERFHSTLTHKGNEVQGESIFDDTPPT